jgi:hypothetical protein
LRRGTKGENRMEAAETLLAPVWRIPSMVGRAAKTFPPWGSRFPDTTLQQVQIGRRQSATFSLLLRRTLRDGGARYWRSPLATGTTIHRGPLPTIFLIIGPPRLTSDTGGCWNHIDHNPDRHYSAPPGSIAVGPLLSSAYESDWSHPYSSTGGAAYTSRHGLKGFAQERAVMADWYLLVYGNGLDLVHRAFLYIDAYQRH